MDPAATEGSSTQTEDAGGGGQKNRPVENASGAS